MKNTTTSADERLVDREVVNGLVGLLFPPTRQRRLLQQTRTHTAQSYYSSDR